MSGDRDPGAEAVATYLLFRRTADRLARSAERNLEGLGLSVAQYSVLRNLPDRGELSSAELAGRIIRAPSNITALIGRMERKGLVRRRRDLPDRRVVRVGLTAEGRALRDRLTPLHRRHLVEVFSALEPEARARLREWLEVLDRRLVEMEERARGPAGPREGSREGDGADGTSGEAG